MGRETLEEPLMALGDIPLPVRAPFRHRTRGASIRCALRGLLSLWHHEPNLRVQLVIAGLVIVAGLAVRLSIADWRWVSLAIGLVVLAEILNTIVERMVDLTIGAQQHPVAGWVKDAAAGSVLAACLMAMVIGGLTFGLHLVGR